MWSLLPQIVAAFDEYAYDYISSMIHPIDNYICIGTDRLVATPALLEGVMRIAHKILSDKNQDVEAQYASKIVETLFAAVRTGNDVCLCMQFLSLLLQPQCWIMFVVLV